MKSNYQKYSKAILSTINIPKSIPEIHQETNIPISTLYRTVSKLKKEKEIKISGKLENGTRQKLYQYTKQNSILNNVKVNFILDTIRTNPGIRYLELQHLTYYSHGVLSNVLRKLETNCLIVAKRYPKKTYFFPVHIPENEYTVWINLRHKILGKILFYLLLRKKATFKEIHHMLNLSKSVTSYHLTNLAKDELIYKTHFPVFFRLRDESKLQKVYDKIQSEFALHESDSKDMSELIQVQSANRYGRRENSW